MTAPLEAAYATSGVIFGDRKAAIEEMLIMDPPPASIIVGRAYLHVSIMLLRLTSIIRSHPSSSTSRTVPGLPIPLMPTLLNKMFRCPNRSIAVSTIALQSALRVTSATKADVSPPASFMAATVLPALSASTSTTRTLAPCLAKRTAVASPVPSAQPARLPPPVTIATFPFNLVPLFSKIGVISFFT